MPDKRIIVISDPHCGHVAGLTPPDWQIAETKNSHTKRNKWARLQRELWEQYKLLLHKWGPFDRGFSLGDMIDGKGLRSGSTELITADREEQCDMAVQVHNEVRLHAHRGFKWIGVYGTPYHTGNGEDWENIVADRAGFHKIGAHEWVDINGIIFDLKHFVSSSIIPHGRHTSIARDRLWNILWNERGLTPRANVILRGHVHYLNFCGGPDWLALTVPALQGMGSKFGSRVCTGLVDWGFFIADIDKHGHLDWHAPTIQIEAQKTEALKL